jgi:pilus assembly protein Flp/PilA
MLNLISSFARDDSGAAAVEYGLLVALIAAVIVVSVGLLGGVVNTAFVTVCNAITPGTC